MALDESVFLGIDNDSEDGSQESDGGKQVEQIHIAGCRVFCVGCIIVRFRFKFENVVRETTVCLFVLHGLKVSVSLKNIK